MGEIKDVAIVVACHDLRDAEKAHAEAKRIFSEVPQFGYEDAGFDSLVSEIVPGVVNGGASFFIAPDGSKYGWSTADKAAVARDRFCAWLEAQRYEDGSTSYNYVRVLVKAPKVYGIDVEEVR